ncbi:MAG: hypothetical protein HS111_31470 [Kofleriaceae bacterium]|nr:hypothetical protein [Kofleriaceae bacterium]
MTLPEMLSIDLIRHLRPVVSALQDAARRAGRPARARRDQRRAQHRRGRRARPGATACGCCGSPPARREVRAALAVASAWGYLDAAEIAPADAVADRLGGVLYGRMRRGG